MIRSAFSTPPCFIFAELRNTSQTSQRDLLNSDRLLTERTSDPVLCEVWTESFNKSQLKESLIGHTWQSTPTYSHIKIHLESTQLHVLTNSKQDRCIPYTVHAGCELWVIILYHTSSGWSTIELLCRAKPLFSTAPDHYCCNLQTQTAGSASHRETENVRRWIRREEYKRGE